jgi:hypothetical protein
MAVDNQPTLGFFTFKFFIAFIFMNPLAESVDREQYRVRVIPFGFGQTAIQDKHFDEVPQAFGFHYTP